MTYLTIDAIKQQLRIDENFTLDDVLLESLGDGAENFLEAHLNIALDDVCADNSGYLPDALYRALLILVSYLYDNDGSGENKEIPNAFWVLCAPYKKYSIA